MKGWTPKTLFMVFNLEKQLSILNYNQIPNTRPRTQPQAATTKLIEQQLKQLFPRKSGI